MLSLNRGSFQGVIFCHFMQKIHNEKRIHLRNPPQGEPEPYCFWQAYFVSQLISVILSPLSPRSGTLTQFILVLYGTGSVSPSSSDKAQPANDNCKTLDLRQICIGKTGRQEVTVTTAEGGGWCNYWVMLGCDMWSSVCGEQDKTWPHVFSAGSVFSERLNCEQTYFKSHNYLIQTADIVLPLLSFSFNLKWRSNFWWEQI